MLRRWAGLGLALCACGGGVAAPEASTMIVQSARAVPAPADDVAEVTVRMPSTVRYDQALLRAERPKIRVRVVNRSARPIDVSNLRVHLASERDGTALRCAKDAGPERGAREPLTLAPGDALDVERAVDCVLPLAGSYTIRVAVSFGQEGWREPRAVHVAHLAVKSSGTLAARPIGDGGLLAAVSAGSIAAPASGQGHGRIAIAIVNGTGATLPVPPLKVRALVRRSGAGPACEGEAVPLHVPAFLDPGAAHREPVELSCIALGAPGTYGVELRLVVDGGDDVGLGTVRVDVTNDPSLVVPRTWP